MKYLQVTMENGDVFEIQAHVIAVDRACYYATKEEGEQETEARSAIYHSEYNYTIQEDTELVDWVKNNMNWEDVSQYARKIEKNPQLPDYQRLWNTAEMEIIQKD